jgi:hypothetical protein
LWAAWLEIDQSADELTELFGYSVDRLSSRALHPLAAVTAA